MIPKIALEEIQTFPSELSRVASASPSGLADITVKWGGSELLVTLLSPSGKTITPTSSGVFRYTEGDTFASYWLYSPEAGEWRVQVKGIDVPDSGEAYRIDIHPVQEQINIVRVPSVRCPTIQAGIDTMFAMGGGTVLIDKGEYNETGIVLRDSVDLQGSGVDSTIINGGNKGTVLSANDSVSANVSGFTIKGSSPNGQGDCALLVTGNSIIKVFDCTFTENKNCLSARGSSILFSISNTVSNNTGRAFDARGNALIQITNNIITNNGEDFHKVGQGKIVVWSDSLNSFSRDSFLVVF
jgi:hypothetical protein